jgi:hypothetical protein
VRVSLGEFPIGGVEREQPPLLEELQHVITFDNGQLAAAAIG